jgi:hypothetical protein
MYRRASRPGLPMVLAVAAGVVAAAGAGRSSIPALLAAKEQPHPGDILAQATSWFPEVNASRGCYYKVVQRPQLGWHAAEESCGDMASGAHLASVVSSEEFTQLASVAKAYSVKVRTATRFAVHM